MSSPEQSHDLVRAINHDLVRAINRLAREVHHLRALLDPELLGTAQIRVHAGENDLNVGINDWPEGYLRVDND